MTEAPLKQFLPLLPEEKTHRFHKKSIFILVIGIVAGLLIGYVIFNRTALAPIGNPLTTQKNPLARTNGQAGDTSSQQIFIDRQIPGDVVLIQEITLNEAGWIAIHDDNNGQPGNILGAYYLPAGTHANQLVPLLRGVEDEISYIAVIHDDNGDRVFDYKLDTPRLDPSGNQETAGFDVVAASPSGY